MVSGYLRVIKNSIIFRDLPDCSSAFNATPGCLRQVRSDLLKFDPVRVACPPLSFEDL